MKMESKFDLGDELKDRVTGAVGVAVAITFYDTGCTHYGVQPLKLKDGRATIAEWFWLDESRFDVTSSPRISLHIQPGTARGGPSPTTPDW